MQNSLEPLKVRIDSCDLPLRNLRAATYNIHKCVGSDRRPDPVRIAAVIDELNADVVGLQEVDNRSGGSSESAQMDFIAGKTGYEAIPGPTIKSTSGRYGNVLLTRWPVLEKSEIDISFSHREPRGAIDVVLSIHDQEVRVIVTHLGLTFPERWQQITRLSDVITGRPAPLLILLGDINEWFPTARGVRRLHRILGKSPVIRSFPARWPLLPLDRIWVKPRSALKSARVHKSRLARHASDHLPVVGEIRVP